MSIFTKLSLSFSILFIGAWSLHAQQISQSTELTLDGYFQRHEIDVYSNIQYVVFSGLLPGESYQLIADGEAGTGYCIPSLALDTPSNAAENAEVDPTHNLLRFTAQASSVRIRLEFPCTWPENTVSKQYLSLICNTCRKKDLKSYQESLFATLETEGGYGAEDLIKEVLIGGNCFDVTNVSFSGNAAQIGKFSNGLTNIGFASGVIMATGDISVAVGPNDQDNASAGFGAGSGDADLSQLSGSGAIFDLANIEFDFTPTQTPLSFQYVFASEEYCEYVGSQFNDAFGFFVSGPGISGPFGGAANIAVIPTTTTNVTINNVNHLSNSGLFTNNTGPGGILCGQAPSASPAVNEVQFDGYTKVMAAVANVVPCETYHIKLKIADVGDGIYDSAVFLKSGSFGSGGRASVDWVVNDDYDIDEVYEACGTVKLVFHRVGGNINLPLPVTYTITGTASSGIDFSPIPAAVVIPAGQTEITITVNIFNDMILEGPESIIITLSNLCSCLHPQETLIINDLPDMVVAADTVIICGPGLGTLNALASGGVEPFTYNWSNGSMDPEITVAVNTSTNFRVTVTDDCGRTKVATGRIIVTPLPIAQLLPPTPQLCPGQSALLKINFSGTGPFDVNYNFNGNPQPTIYGITENPWFLEVSQAGLYQITNVTDSLGCVGPGQGVLIVGVSTLNLSGVATNVSCSGSTNGAINTTVTGGMGPFVYSWTAPINIGNVADPINLPAGTYTVTVTDGFGCTNSNTYTLAPPNPILPSILGTTVSNCANPTGGSISLSVAGGNPSYSYLWNTGSTAQNPNGLTAGNYTVTIIDQSNCSTTATATVPGDFVLPDAVASAPGPVNCYNPSILLDGTGSSTGSNYSYLWTANPGNILSGANTLMPSVNQGGNYVIQVTNSSNGCVNTDTVAVNANLNTPVAEAGPTPTITCTLPTPTLSGAGSSQGSNFTYTWTATQGGNIVSGDTTLSPVVGSTGLYTIQVTNTSNGCVNTDSVNVNINTAQPNAVVANPGVLTCTVGSVTLDGSNSTPSGQINFAWSTSNGVIQSGQNLPNPVVSAAGDYTLVVTNTSNGCIDSVTVAVLPDNTIPTANAAYQDTITCAVTQSVLDGTGSSTGANYTYAWSSTTGILIGNTNNLQATAGAPGSYTLVVTNTTNNCTSTYDVDVPSNLVLPLADAGADQILNCTAPTLNLDGTNSSTGNQYSYNWQASNGGNIVSGQNTLTPTVNEPGLYTIVVTNNLNGCTSDNTTEILNDANAPILQMATPGTLNCINAQVNLSANGSSTGPNYSYVWTGPGILSGDTTLNISVNQAGNYTLVITNSDNGCTTNATMPVNQDIAPPPADAGPDIVLNCTSPSLNLGGPGNPNGPNFTFQWAGAGIVSGNNGPNPTVNQGGLYNLTVTNTANGCTSTDQASVNLDFVAPQANAGPGFELNCVQTSYGIQANASAGANFSYSWVAQNGSPINPPNALNPTVSNPDTYVLTVLNSANGCTSTTSVQITESVDIPTTIAGTATTLNCAVLTQNLNAAGTATGPNFVYQWEAGPGANILNGGNTLTPTVNAPGLYILHVVNTDNSCSNTDTVLVPQDIVPPNIDAGATITLTCYNPTATLQGSVTSPGNFNYQWQAQNGGNIQNGGNTLSPSINAAGTYVLTVLNTLNGCSSVDQVAISVDQVNPIAAIAQPGILNCTNTQMPLDAAASSTGNMQYAWSSANGHFVNQNNPLAPIVDEPGNYQLLVTNLTNGCTATTSVNMLQDVALPTAEAGNGGLLTCAVTSLSLNGAGSSQNGNFTYNWAGPGILAGNTTLTPNINAGGVYTITVTNQDNGCTSTDQTTVNTDTQLPIATIAAPGLLTCAQTTVVLSSTGSIGNNISYSWSTQNGNILNGQTTAQPSVNQPGTYSLLVTNTSNGCTNTANTNVNQDIAIPLADAGPGFFLTCATNQYNLQGSASTGAAFSYNWTTTGGNIVSGANTLNPLVDRLGLYQLLVTNTANGCTNTDLVQVDQETNVPTDFTIVLDPPTCHDDDGTINFSQIIGGVGPYVYSIDGGQNYYPASEFIDITPGNYTLWIQDINGCEYQKPLVVPQAPDPAITIVPEILISLGDSVHLKAQLPPGYPLALVDTIIWTPLDGLTFTGTDLLSLLRPFARPFSTTEYTVTLISGEGCIAEDRVIIRVDNEPRIYIPNAFSPWKADGFNDIVYIFADEKQILNIQSFKIFDRWGELVFEDYNFLPNDPGHGWNGQLRGELLNPAVFVYVAEVVLIDGRTILFKGDITLVR